MPAHNIRSAAIALGGDVAGRNRILCPGPGHSRKDRSLSVTFNGDSFVCHSFSKDDWRECRDHVKALLGFSDEKPRPAANNNAPLPIDIDSLKKQNDALSIWSRSVPIAGIISQEEFRSILCLSEWDAIFRKQPRVDGRRDSVGRACIHQRLCGQQRNNDAPHRIGLRQYGVRSRQATYLI
jgi:hypothetical protein